MVDLEGLRSAVVRSAGHWNLLFDEGDPNILDAYFHARGIEGSLGEEPPSDLPSGANGVLIVEKVEKHLIASSILRHVQPEELGSRAEILIRSLHARSLMRGRGFADMYVGALYAWHGCVPMAKLVRRTYVTAAGEVPYTRQQRLNEHELILSSTSSGERRGAWIRFGMSIARLFEKNRGKRDDEIDDSWVPQDSPYWGIRQE